MSRKAHEPTEESRKAVEAMVGYGLRREQVAAYLEISLPTLRKHYKPELARAKAVSTATVAKSLYQMATEGKTSGPKVAAAIFWLKTQDGWKEVSGLEIAQYGSDGKPLEPVRVIERIIRAPTS